MTKKQQKTKKTETTKNQETNTDIAKQVIETPLQNYVQNNYLPFAWSVTLDRALVYSTDGLKPIQRRILYTAYKSHITDKSPKIKSATFEGRVMVYSPHSGSYSSMVNIAAPEVPGQPRPIRVPLIRGKGNWGGVESPPAACLSGDTKIQILDQEDLENYYE